MAHFHVQMVGGLVEQQQIGLLPGDQSQCQPGLFTTGKVQHRLLGTAAVEVEAAKKVAQLLLPGLRRQSGQVQQRAGLRIEAVELVLGKVADRQMLAGLQLTGNQRQAASQGLDQGRLARTIGAEHADTCAGGQLQLDVVQDRRTFVTKHAITQIQQRVGLPVGLAEAEVERRVDMRRAEQLHALQCLESALGLTGLGRLGAEAGDVLLHVFALRLLFLEGGLLLAQTLGAGAFELAVATPVQGQLL